MNVFDVYHPWDVRFVHGSGAIVTDDSGKKYLDFYGGHGVISIGHNHTTWANALTERLGRISYYSNAITITEQEAVAVQLNRLAGLENYRLFLCNSGAEANENALKLASFRTGRSKVLAFKGAFHGRTAGAVAVTDNPVIRPEFGREIVQEFMDLDDAEAVKNALLSEKYAAVIVEGIQGVSGVFEPTHDVWKVLDEWCPRTGTVFIADEVQSGCGRTGHWFAHQFHEVKPDIVTMAKGIGNGFPVAGLVVQPAILPVKGQLGTTFGGSYLACAAMQAVASVIESENLLQAAKELGAELKLKLCAIEGVKTVRGRGLMLGIELEIPAVEVQELLRNYGVIAGVSSCKYTLRILPPLNITREEIGQFLHTFRTVMSLLMVEPQILEA